MFGRYPSPSKDENKTVDDDTVVDLTTTAPSTAPSHSASASTSSPISNQPTTLLEDEEEHKYDSTAEDVAAVADFLATTASVRAEAHETYVHTSTIRQETQNRGAGLDEVWAVGQFVGVKVPNKRNNGYEQHNNNTFRVLTPYGLIKNRLKPEQFIPINNNAFKADLDPLQPHWATPQDVTFTLASFDDKSIMDVSNAHLTAERVARDGRMRIAMRARYGNSESATDEKEEKKEKRGRGRPSKKNKTPLASLPELRRNAIKAASVPDSDNRYEPDAVLCIPEFILGERYVDDVKSYKITWVGLDDSYCTWEPADTFDTVDAFKDLVCNWNDYKAEVSYRVRKHTSKKGRVRR